MLFTLFLTQALAETGVVDTSVPMGGHAYRTTTDIPEVLECAWVDIDDRVPLGEPYSLGLNNGCGFTVQVREPDCTEEDLDEDWEGCARLELAPSGAGREGTSAESGPEGTLQLEWFDPAVPGVVATATWELEYSEGGGGSWDSDPGRSSTAEGCGGGCSTSTPALPWAAALAGLLLIARRRP